MQPSVATDPVSKLSVVEKLLDTLQNAKENKVIKVSVCLISYGTMRLGDFGCFGNGEFCVFFPS